MRAKVGRWGNGFALRVRRADLEAAGVSEGDVVEVAVIRRSPQRGIDLQSMPTFTDPDRSASVRHDRYLFG